MIITPKIRGFVCVTAHPDGCAARVREQIALVDARGPFAGPRNALVVGASTGYGLASRISAAIGAGAATLGVFLEKPGSERRCGTAGWYNASALGQILAERGLPAPSINADAFSDASKQSAIAQLRDGAGPVDLLVYSLAAPRRQHPDTGVVHRSVLKPIGRTLTERSLDTDRAEIAEWTVGAASEQEIADTVAVMGGDDWKRWVDALDHAGLLADDFKTVAYTYIGERITWPIYGHATIGAAKKDLEQAAAQLRARLSERQEARIAVMKAVVTQASAAIPIMPLYLSLLFDIMKRKGTHEGCIEQIDSLFRECVYAATGDGGRRMDPESRWRMDSKELDPSVQREIESRWPEISTENLMERTDFAGYRQEFLGLFGFGRDGVDYAADADPVAPMPGLVN